MVSLSQALSALHRLQPALSRLHVTRIGVFGSVARGESRPDSDIDVLVEMSGEGDLFDLVAVKRLLESEFGRRVDVVTRGGLRPDARDAVLREVRYAA
jgi:predicted nucleotidyltransferase